jgi:hypothetical protein
MFGVMNSVRRMMSGSRMAMVAAPVAMAGLAAPMMGAGPHDWHFGWGRYEPRRVEVVVRPEPRCEVRRECVEVVPCDLRITAYQARDTVFVVVSGTNTSGGYTTSLAAVDTCGPCPRLQLRNTPGFGCATQALSPFTLNGAFRAERCVSEVQVRIGDRVISAPVCAVACL